MMVPLLWRYLIEQYIKVLLLAVGAFTAILVIMRLEETARFASIGASWKQLLLFNLYELPHMLPIAIPISCLLSSYLLFSRLSHSQELVSLRAAGLSLPQVLSPLCLMALIVGCFGLYLASEITTDSRLASRRMVAELTSVNPLALMHNVKFLRQKQVFVETGHRNGNDSAENVFIVVRNKNYRRLSMLCAKRLNYKDENLEGTNVCLISSIPSDDAEGFDHLLLENQHNMITPAAEFTQMMKETSWRVSSDYLRMPLLLSRREIEKQAVAAAQTKLEKKARLVRLHHTDNEIVRRFSIGLSPLPFTLFGAAFGIDIGRKRSKKSLITVVLLSALSLCCFVIAKEMGRTIWAATSLYFIPYLILPLCSLFQIKRIAKGKEC